MTAAAAAGSTERTRLGEACRSAGDPPATGGDNENENDKQKRKTKNEQERGERATTSDGRCARDGRPRCSSSHCPSGQSLL
jgi:hypothetical protein